MWRRLTRTTGRTKPGFHTTHNTHRTDTRTTQHIIYQGLRDQVREQAREMVLHGDTGQRFEGLAEVPHGGFMYVL